MPKKNHILQLHSNDSGTELTSGNNLLNDNTIWQDVTHKGINLLKIDFSRRSRNPDAHSKAILFLIKRFQLMNLSSNSKEESFLFFTIRKN